LKIKTNENDDDETLMTRGKMCVKKTENSILDEFRRNSHATYAR